MVTCFNAWNMNNFKFTNVVFYWENFTKNCQLSIRLYNINNYWTVCNFSNMCISISAQYMYVHMNTLHAWTIPMMLSCGPVAMIHNKKTNWNTRFVAKHKCHSSYTTLILFLFYLLSHTQMPILQWYKLDISSFNIYSMING